MNYNNRRCSVKGIICYTTIDISLHMSFGVFRITGILAEEIPFIGRKEEGAGIDIAHKEVRGIIRHYKETPLKPQR